MTTISLLLLVVAFGFANFTLPQEHKFSLLFATQVFYLLMLICRDDPTKTR